MTKQTKEKEPDKPDELNFFISLVNPWGHLTNRINEDQ